MPISDKDSRQALISEIISQEQVSTQTELVEMLEARGKIVTQATVSRDLTEMGVYTDRGNSSKRHYIIPTFSQIAEPTIKRDQLQRVIGEWATEVFTAGNMVVIKTAPGSAHVVASALDRSDQPEIVATLAGDDTVFVVVKDKMKNPIAEELGKELKKIAGL